jgi:hypothetical protein
MKINYKFIYCFLSFSSILYQSFAIITRDDVSDSKFIELGKKYSDILCHFPMGEGTLIDSFWVITAGHIGKDLKRDLQNGLSPGVKINGKDYPIENIFVHPDFQPIVNDIALVKLKEKVTNSRYVKLYADQDEIGKNIIVAGMGDTGNGLTGPAKMDKIVRAATNKIDSVDENWIAFHFDSPGSKNATDLEGISGPGDSGGPALIEKKNILCIIGISSNQKDEGNKKGCYGVMEYYTRISTYTKWIISTLIHNKDKSQAISSISPLNLNDKLLEYSGNYGIRKIVFNNNNLFFQRESEPLIQMKQIEKDLFIWDDDATKLQFFRDKSNSIVGFEIRRKNGEIVKVDKTK